MKLFIKIIIILLFSFLLTGCYDYNELNDSAIVSAISVDLDEADKTKYVIGVQIMNAKKKENNNVSEITYFEMKGNSIYEALQKMMLDSPKQLYLGHTEVVIIGETLLKEKNPLEYLDFFMRDSSAEKDAVVITTKNNKAGDVLKILTPLETIPSQNLKQSLFNSARLSGITNIITLDELISSLMDSGEEIILPSVEIYGKVNKGENTDNISNSDPSTKLTFSDLVVLKNNKLIGFLNDKESFGYNIVTSEGGETYIKFKCDNNNYGNLKITSLKTKQNISFKNNIPTVEIKNYTNANIIEYNCQMDLLKNDEKIKEIQHIAEMKIEESIKDLTNKLYINYQTDALKYGSKFYKLKNKEMKKLGYSKENIKEYIKFNIDSNVKIDSAGLSTKSIYEGGK